MINVYNDYNLESNEKTRDQLKHLIEKNIQNFYIKFLYLNIKLFVTILLDSLMYYIIQPPSTIF